MFDLALSGHTYARRLARLQHSAARRQSQQPAGTWADRSGRTRRSSCGPAAAPEPGSRRQPAWRRRPSPMPAYKTSCNNCMCCMQSGCSSYIRVTMNGRHRQSSTLLSAFWLQQLECRGAGYGKVLSGSVPGTMSREQYAVYQCFQVLRVARQQMSSLSHMTCRLLSKSNGPAVEIPSRTAKRWLLTHTTHLESLLLAVRKRAAELRHRRFADVLRITAGRCWRWLAERLLRLACSGRA